MTDPLPAWVKPSTLAVVWMASIAYSARRALIAIELLGRYPSPESEDWPVWAVTAFIVGLPWMAISIYAVRWWLRRRPH
jgi:hypothetical protein